MSGRTMSVALLCAVGVFAAAGGPFRAFNVVPLPRGNERQIAADCVEYVRRTGNRVCLCSMTLHPEGKPAMEKPRRSARASGPGSAVRSTMRRLSASRRTWSGRCGPSLREMRPTAVHTSARFDEVLGRLSAATGE